MTDHITIPSTYMGQIDARLYVDPDVYSDSYAMRLEVAGDEREADTDGDCSACRGHGQIKHDFRKATS